MKKKDKDKLENELYFLLGLTCSNCDEEWYAQDHGWVVKNATDSDVEIMVKNYLPKAISIGWDVSISDTILCPKCNNT